MTDTQKVEDGTWIDRVHDGRRVVMDNSFTLRDLATAFSLIGNQQVAITLERIADSNDEAVKDMVQAVGEDLTRQVRSGDELFSGLFTAALEAAQEKP